jgi:hypothetical protein
VRIETLLGYHTPKSSTLSVGRQEWTTWEYISSLHPDQDEGVTLALPQALPSRSSPLRSSFFLSLSFANAAILGVRSEREAMEESVWMIWSSWFIVP